MTFVCNWDGQEVTEYPAVTMRPDPRVVWHTQTKEWSFCEKHWVEHSTEIWGMFPKIVVPSIKKMAAAFIEQGKQMGFIK